VSDEQRVILQMVSEGRITPDDGVKLLEALARGEEKCCAGVPDRPSPRRRRLLMSAGGERIHDMGHMLRTVVHDAMGGAGIEIGEREEDPFEMEGGGLPMEDPLEIPDGTELVLRSRLCASGCAGDVFLRGVPGSLCRVLSGDPSEVRVYRDDDTVMLRWSDGDLDLEVPASVARVTVDIIGGDLVADALLSRSRLRSKGGRITIADAVRGFDAKTMGGAMSVSLADGWRESSRIATMGGDIRIDVPAGLSARISVRSFGGDVSAEEGLGEVTESGRPGSVRFDLATGSGEDLPELKVRTMGGGVSIGRPGSRDGGGEPAGGPRDE